MLRQGSEGGRSVDHTGCTSRLGDDRPSEGGKLVTQLDVAEGLGRAGRDRRAEGERVQPAAQASVELVVLRAVRVELVGQRRECCSVEQRDIRSEGELGGEPGRLPSPPEPRSSKQSFARHSFC